MDERTPRSLIQGVLTSASVEKSARKRGTPRPKRTPSAKDVALQMLTRTRSATKRKAPMISTPNEGTTPRTLIGGLLQVSSASALPKRARRNSQGSAARNTSTARRRSLRQSIGKTGDTPRTLIENYLKEAAMETPVLYDKEVPSASPDSDEQSAPTEQDAQAVDRSVGISDPHVEAQEDGSLDEEQAEGNRVVDTEEAVVPAESDGEPTETTPTMSTLQTLKKSKWKDLVTPKELPAPAAGERQATTFLDESTTGETTFKKPPPVPRAERTKISGSAMPSSLVKSIFQHFSQARVSRDALKAIDHGSNLFFKQMSSDLKAYSEHAGRKTIEPQDVELLMKRQNFITSKQSLHSLIEKYLPLEYRKEVIPTVQSGNRVVPE